jgi:AmmeMemoRadiSam system protein B
MDARSPAVAGAFYPFSKESVTGQLKELFGYWKIDLEGLKKRKRIPCRGIVAPHAGWDYSGYVAARVYADAPHADTVILMGPNHYGVGPDISVSDADAWQTPLGVLKVDKELAAGICKDSSAEEDSMAHRREHSIEVHLPFLQVSQNDFRIVPISIKHYAPDENFLAACRELGKAIAAAVKKSKKKVLIVASTDFTHYEPQEAAKYKDSAAMAAIEKLDEAGLFKTVAEKRISMCGYAGVAAALVACKILGAKKAEKVAYMTSGDTTEDTSAVVGYGGLRIG